MLNHIFNQNLLEDNKKDNILNEININNITVKEEKFDNMYEFYKALFVFNKMFPKLKINFV